MMIMIMIVIVIIICAGDLTRKKQSCRGSGREKNSYKLKKTHLIPHPPPHPHHFSNGPSLSYNTYFMRSLVEYRFGHYKM